MAQAMSEQGLTQQALADRSGVTQGHIGQLIRGERGKIPASLTDLLAGLGLELTVTPGKAEGTR